MIHGIKPTLDKVCTVCGNPLSSCEKGWQEQVKCCPDCYHTEEFYSREQVLSLLEQYRFFIQDNLVVNPYKKYDLRRPSSRILSDFVDKKKER